MKLWENLVLTSPKFVSGLTITKDNFYNYFNFHFTALVHLIIFYFHSVIVFPQILPFDFGSEPMNSGDTISVACSINKGDLPLKITWFLNGKNAEIISGVIVNRVNKKLSTLSIDNIDETHAGVYECVAENSAGKNSFSAMLHVTGILFVF